MPKEPVFRFKRQNIGRLCDGCHYFDPNGIGERKCCSRPESSPQCVQIVPKEGYVFFIFEKVGEI